MGREKARGEKITEKAGGGGRARRGQTLGPRESARRVLPKLASRDFKPIV